MNRGLTFDTLPPPGPAWGGSLMGTSLMATLMLTSGLRLVAWPFAILGAVILVVLVVGFAVYRTPHFHQDLMAPWAMWFIGIMALGTAWTKLTGAHWCILVGFWVGAPLCLVAYANQLRRFSGTPNFAWGLPLVGPIMASNTAGSIAELTGQRAYWALGIGCMILAVIAAYPLFFRVYLAAFRGEADIDGPAAATTWIPLGVVGQSTSAIALLFGTRVEVVVGSALLILAIPMALFAMWHFYPAVLKWVDYSPAWWASTFPTGAIGVGGYSLAQAWDLDWLSALATALPALLILHWSLCAARFLSWWFALRR